MADRCSACGSDQRILLDTGRCIPCERGTQPSYMRLREEAKAAKKIEDAHKRIDDAIDSVRAKPKPKPKKPAPEPKKRSAHLGIDWKSWAIRAIRQIAYNTPAGTYLKVDCPKCRRPKLERKPYEVVCESCRFKVEAPAASHHLL